jgi:hypothetical protein
MRAVSVAAHSNTKVWYMEAIPPAPAPFDAILKAALATNVALSPRELALINQILGDENVGAKINDLFTKILADGKIDVYDVPNLVLVLTEIYKTHIINKGITDVNVINMIELTLDCILDSDLVPIPEMEKKIMKSIIETSLKLLETNLPAIKSGWSLVYGCLRSCCEGRPAPSKPL